MTCLYQGLAELKDNIILQKFQNWENSLLLWKPYMASTEEKNRTPPDWIGQDWVLSYSDITMIKKQKTL